MKNNVIFLNDKKRELKSNSGPVIECDSAIKTRTEYYHAISRITELQNLIDMEEENIHRYLEQQVLNK